jgi:hypothetical protein
MVPNKFIALSVMLLVSSYSMAQSTEAAADDKPMLQASGAPIAKPSLRSAASSKTEASKEVKFAAPRPGELTVSDRDFNRFIFPAPVTQLVFPAGASLLGKPVYLSGNTQVLIQFKPGNDKSVQMVVEVEGGQVHTFTLNPRPVDGVTQRVDGARERNTAAAARSAKADAAAPGAAAPRGEDIELLKRVVQGDIPAGFDSVKLPRPTRFDKFTVVPLAGWSDGSARRVMVFSLVSVPGQTAVVSPPQFYRAGISAVLLDGDVVDASSSPNLYVVEETQDE